MRDKPQAVTHTHTHTHIPDQDQQPGMKETWIQEREREREREEGSKGEMKRMKKEGRSPCKIHTTRTQKTIEYTHILRIRQLPIALSISHTLTCILSHRHTPKQTVWVGVAIQIPLAGNMIIGRVVWMKRDLSLL